MIETDWPFDDLPRGGFGAIYADPPWHFKVHKEGSERSASSKYTVMSTPAIAALPVGDLAAPACALFMWVSWPQLPDAFTVMNGWGFTYKTCAFAWMKAKVRQLDMFDDPKPSMGMGYWTRSNSEVCLLATRGRPKRLSGGVRQGIIEPGRQHSRKPDCVPERIEQLVAGPYLELFARTPRDGWSSWGNQTQRFDEPVTSP